MTALVRAPDRDTAREDFLLFRSGEQLLGFPLPSVREIMRFRGVTLVPRAPREVIGITSVRGTITTVFDFSMLLDNVPGQRTRHNRVLLVRLQNELIALLVDSVLQVTRLMPSEIETEVGLEFPVPILGIARPRVHEGARGRNLSAELRGQDTVVVLMDPVTIFRERGNA